MAAPTPLLVADGTPPWLREMLRRLTGPDAAEKALITSLVVIMLETGFYLEGGSNNTTGCFDVAVMKALPNELCLEKTDGIYKITLHVLDSNNIVQCVVIPMGSLLMVNLLVPEHPDILETLPVSCDDFIDSYAADAFSVKNLYILSESFKNPLLVVKSRMLEDKLNCHHIFHLPVEILTLICEYLTPQEFGKFARTCKKASTLQEIDRIWKTFSRKFFPSRKTSAEESWKDFTIYQIRRQKQLEETNRAARKQINDEYRKHKDVQEEEKIRERLEFSKAVEKELRTTVIQAREKEPGKFELRITPETTKLDNFPFDPNVEIPRAKRRELAKACCQVKVDP